MTTWFPQADVKCRRILSAYCALGYLSAPSVSEVALHPLFSPSEPSWRSAGWLSMWEEGALMNASAICHRTLRNASQSDHFKDIPFFHQPISSCV